MGAVSDAPSFGGRGRGSCQLAGQGCDLPMDLGNFASMARRAASRPERRPIRIWISSSISVGCRSCQTPGNTSYQEHRLTYQILCGKINNY